MNRARRCRRPTPSVPFHFPTSTLAYFQFVFAAITPLLFLGSVLGRIKFSAWCLLVPLWSTFVYSIDAFLLWGGGYFAQEGALDYSGGYVIHMSAGVSGFVAAWVLGPRLLRDRQHFLPNNLVMAAVGAGILWLGWNGFNGGDPYYAGSDAAAAVVNTNLATAAGLLTWVALDAWLVQGEEAHLPRCGERHDLRPGRDHPLRRLGQRPGRHLRRRHLLRHRVGGLELPLQGPPVLEGGRRPRRDLHPRHRRLLRRPAARHLRGPEQRLGRLWPPGCLPARSSPPRATQYATAKGSCVPFGVNGLIYTGSAHQLWEQFRAAIWVILWSALVTFILMKLIGWSSEAPGTRTRSSRSATWPSTARRPSPRSPSPSGSGTPSAARARGAACSRTSPRRPDDPVPSGAVRQLERPLRSQGDNAT